MARQRRSSSCAWTSTRICTAGAHRVVLDDWQSITDTIDACAELLHSHVRLRDQFWSGPTGNNGNMVTDSADLVRVGYGKEEWSMMCTSHSLDGVPMCADKTPTINSPPGGLYPAKQKSQDKDQESCSKRGDKSASLGQLYTRINDVMQTDFTRCLTLCGERCAQWGVDTSQMLAYLHKDVEASKLDMTLRWQREDLLSLYFTERRAIVAAQKRVYHICCQKQLRLEEINGRTRIKLEQRRFFDFMNTRWPAWKAIKPVDKKCHPGNDRALRTKLHEAEREHLFEMAKTELSKCYFEYTRFAYALDAARESLIDNYAVVFRRNKSNKRRSASKKNRDKLPTLRPKVVMPPLRYPAFFSMEEVQRHS